MFKKDQRVLYMGRSVWYIATVIEDQNPDKDSVTIQPHGLKTNLSVSWIPFDTSIERLVEIPVTCRSVEQAVQHLIRAKNWDK